MRESTAEANSRIEGWHVTVVDRTSLVVKGRGRFVLPAGVYRPVVRGLVLALGMGGGPGLLALFVSFKFGEKGLSRILINSRTG